MILVLTNILETLILASPKKAMAFGKIVVDHINSGNEVTLDFSGVEGVTVGFLYLLFTRIYKECGKNIHRLVNVVNVPERAKDSFHYLRNNYEELDSRFAGLMIPTA
ncbi:MAG: STAS-like domain-containing protein [Fusobacteriaceae bacterium]|jgi:hypothetical protein|nr:STAS-like domain-containing protein [Fusobacteriaceae bacterium]